LRQNPLVILEVAHNKDGVQEMLKHLKKLTYRHLHVVIGMVRDKDAAPVLGLLPANASYYFTQAQIPRALPSNELQAKARSFSLEGNTYTDVNEALQAAINHAAPGDLVIVCGSIFLVAEVNKESILQQA